MTKIEFGYQRGFTDALEKVAQLFGDSFFLDMKLHGIRWNKKTFDSVMKLMIENRGLFRDNPNAFIRCNGKNFEVFVEQKGDD